MADESGKIKISIEVDSSDAIDGLEDLQKELAHTEDATQKMGQGTEQGLEKSTAAIEQAVKDAVSALEAENKALKESAETAKSTGKKKKQALDNSDTIEGLDSLKDKTGELDSSLKGLGGAVGLLSPELERMLFVTGELSGGVEATSRLTTLFGGSLGSLLRVAAPVGVAIGALAFAYNRFSGGLKEAEDRLDAAHESMKEGVAQAKAYEARVRSLRVRLGLLSQAEGDLRDARDEAVSLLGDQNNATDEATQRASVYRMGLNKINEALRQASIHNGEHTFELLTLSDAHDQAAAAAQGQVVGLELTTHRALSGSNAISALSDMHDEFTQALNNEMRVVNKYNEAVQEKTALVRIDRAMASGELDQMREAIPLLQQLEGEQRELVSARLQSTIALTEEAEAADAQAEAQERSASASQSSLDDATASANERANLARMLAEAQGQAAVIEHQYAEAVAEVERVVAASGATQEEAQQLLAKAYRDRLQAIDDLEEAEAGHFQKAKERALNTVEIERSAETELEAIRDNRKADLALALADETITREQFREQDKKAEREYNKAINEIRLAQAAEKLGSIKMVTDQVTSFMDAVIAAQLEKINNEEEQALAAASGNMEEQEKIRAKFREKRKRELGAEFATRKGLEIANAVISGASATVAALAPPPVGPGPLLGPFLAGAIAATTAAQIAVISQQQPSFHQGGIVGGDGDRQITAQGGEVVLNRDAVAAMGGAASADSLNRGGGMGAPIVVQMTYRNRVFDQMVVDNLAKGGPLKKALGRATRRGQRGRIGGRL